MVRELRIVRSHTVEGEASSHDEVTTPPPTQQALPVSLAPPKLFSSIVYNTNHSIRTNGVASSCYSWSTSATLMPIQQVLQQLVQNWQH